MEKFDLNELQYIIPDELFLLNEDKREYGSSVAEPQMLDQVADPIAIQGNFTNGILILHQEVDLPPKVMEMLVNMIQAVGHSMNEVGLVNSNAMEGRSLQELYDLNAHKILKFGRIKHPINALPARDYHIHTERATEYLFADSLSVIAEDKVLKVKLWQNLKVLFNISI
jgi:hypothetical protein